MDLALVLISCVSGVFSLYLFTSCFYIDSEARFGVRSRLAGSLFLGVVAKQSEEFRKITRVIIAFMAFMKRLQKQN